MTALKFTNQEEQASEETPEEQPRGEQSEGTPEVPEESSQDA